MRNQITGALSLDLSQEAIASLAETIAGIVTDTVLSRTSSAVSGHVCDSLPLEALESGEAMQLFLDSNELDGSLSASRLAAHLYAHGYVIARLAPAQRPDEASEGDPGEHTRSIPRSWFSRDRD